MNPRRFMPQVTILAAAIALLAACATRPVANSGSERIGPAQPAQSNPPPAYQEPQPATLDAEDAAVYRRLFEPYANLVPALDQLAESGSDERVARSLDALRERPGTAAEVARLYADLTRASRERPQAFDEARWRSVYLLAELRQKDALQPLAEIATAALPDPERAGDAAYATEFRLRARAIVGLQNLQSTAELERIYAGGGPLRGVAAAALYELGKPPRGVKRIDARQAFGEVSSADVHPSGRVVAPGLLRLPPVPAREQQERVVPETSPSR